MRGVRGRSSWGWLLIPLLAVSAGCAGGRAHLEDALRADHNPAAHAPLAAHAYQIHCPDVLELNIAGHPELCGERQLGPDGRVPLGEERVLLDGLTCSQCSQEIADRLQVQHQQVQVQVRGYNSQVLYLIGEINGPQRAIPYQGPETIVDLLQRIGGFGPGAAPESLQVVRSHIADGKAPEIFQVDLNGILLQGDQQSNIRLEPFDQIYVGETSRAHLSSCFPPWLRPLYDTVCGLRHSFSLPPSPSQISSLPLSVPPAGTNAFLPAP